MPELIIWKNQQFDKLRKEIDRMFDRLWGECGLSAFTKTTEEFPKIKFVDNKDILVVMADMSGIRPEDIHIDITENHLTIKYSIKEKKVTDQEGYPRKEQKHRSFSRTVQLPHRIIVDEVNGSYKEGILTIEMPKYKRKNYRELKIET
ncbi:MAG: Hsp20/alpha crystallin family protein [Syntrophales bacterium]